MEKLLVLFNDEVVDELVLDQGEFLIGRDSASDLQLDDGLVSRRHAKLTRVMSDYLAEDLGSTNGTNLNGQAISKQMLKSGDVLKIGHFSLRYLSEPDEQSAEAVAEETVPSPVESAEPEESAQVAETLEHPAAKPKPKIHASHKATLSFVAGPDQGRIEVLQRGLFTIGKPGEGVGTVAARSQGFFLLHVGGELHPMINGEPVQRGGVPLHDGDLIEVGEHRVRITIQS